MRVHRFTISLTLALGLLCMGLAFQVIAEEELIGETEVGGMKVELEVEGAETMWMLMENGILMEMAPMPNDTHHFEAKLEDISVVLELKTPKIAYSKVTATTVNDDTGETISKQLNPMYGGGGFHFGGNFALPPGNYTVTLDIEPPTFMRSDSTKDSWLNPIQVSFPFVSTAEELEEEVEIGDAEVDGMKVELEVEHAETMWMLMPNGMLMEMAPEPEDTHHFEAKLEDISIVLEKKTPQIFYSTVTATAVNDDTGETIGKELNPMYGGGGFHYGGNFALPAGTYTVTLDIAPPTFMRSDSTKDSWLDPIQVAFPFVVEASVEPTDADVARAATEKYKDLSVALADGYAAEEPLECVSVPELGGMGIHYVNAALIDDVFNPAQPEALLYSADEELLGVEYIVTVSDPVTTFDDVEFGPPPPGSPEDWRSLHVWLYKENPSGMFAPFNPDVECPAPEPTDVEVATAATEKYKDLSVALADGYATEEPLECISVPGLGGMGIHYVNMALVDDVFNPAQPEVLLYSADDELLAVEYIITLSDPVTTFDGVEFGPPPPGSPEDSRSLHVWLYKENPSGMFAPFNPDVGCPAPEPTEDFSNVFFSQLSPGLNMISLPLKPVTSFTARSFAEATGATVVIKYDEVAGKFAGYTPTAPDDGFAIEGGKGYIVNTPAGGTVAFTGAAWTNEPPLAAPPANSNTTWAFVVSGLVLDGEIMSARTGNYTVVAKNLRTGAMTSEAVDSSGYFAAAWANLSRRAVVEAGDKIEVAVMDSNGGIVSGPFVHEVTLDSIRDAVVDTRLQLGNIIPERSVLLQNYPNPFNPETWIPFHLKDADSVFIRIFNTSGALVRTLDLGHKDAGVYVSRSSAAYWDGRNEAGEEVSSGIYFYNITAGGLSGTRKMVVKK